MPKAGLALLPLLLFLTSLPAFANDARKGDMFDDGGFTAANRPEVPSDSFHGSDMFGEPQAYMSPDAEMFRGAASIPSPGGNDMFGARRTGEAPPTELYGWDSGGYGGIGGRSR